MRPHTLVPIALLVLLLTASCCQANDTHTGTGGDTSGEKTPDGETEKKETEEAAKEEKTTEIKEEEDVMVLHINNFARALAENKHVLVEFYAPWCGHCKKLEPIYAKAAGKLKKEESAIRLAKVDAIKEEKLAEQFLIEGFPSLKLFIDGDQKEPVDFTGKRTVDGIIEWLKRRTGPGAVTLDAADSAAQFIDAHKIAVVGFFDSLDSEAAKVFTEVVMDMSDTEFAVTSAPEVFQKYEVKSNTVVLFKKFDDGRADFILSEDGKLDKSSLTTFIKENSLEMIIPYNEQTSDKIFSSSILLHCLFFINSTVPTQTALMDQCRTVAKEFKGKMLFVMIDVTHALSHVLNYFGVSEDDAPTVRIINLETSKKFIIPSGDLSVNSLRKLSQEVVDGSAEPYFRTQEIPEDWDKGPVKVLVGKNFESVALDKTKNVFVEFYAPWCGHCKELAPIWEKLAEKYADHDDIIIAKMDATANEVESVAVGGFPTLKYFPAGDAEVVEYTGQRDLESMSKFLDNGGVLPEEEKGAEDEEDETEEDDDEEHDDEEHDDEEHDDEEHDDEAHNDEEPDDDAEEHDNEDDDDDIEGGEGNDDDEDNPEDDSEESADVHTNKDEL